MTRKYLAATLVVVIGLCASSARGGLMLPGIQGTVSLQGGGGVAGVTIKLYEDTDSDGMFNPANDMQVGADIVTDAGGMYSFDNLNTNTGYFVERPMQPFGMGTIPAAISGLLEPGTPNLTIDAFSSNQGVKASSFIPIATSTANDPMAEVLGVERDMYVRLVAGVGEVELRSNAFGVAVLQYDNTSGVVGHGIITWDGPDASASPTPTVGGGLGLGDVDLTQGGINEGFLFMLGIDATGAGDYAKVRIFDEDGAVFSEGMVEIPVTDGTAVAQAYLPFSNLTGPVSPAKVNAIQMILGEGAKSVDAQFDYIGVVGPVVQDFEIVPEPSAVALVCVGLCGLLRLRRR